MPDPEADYEIDFDELPRLSPPPPPSADRELAVVQARAAKVDGAAIAEGTVTDNDRVELLGKKFRVAEKIGLMPLLKFASASDVSTDDPRALSAVYSMLKNCIYEGSPGAASARSARPTTGATATRPPASPTTRATGPSSSSTRWTPGRTPRSCWR